MRPIRPPRRWCSRSIRWPRRCGRSAEASDLAYLARLPYEANAWGHYCEGDLARTAAINRTLVELVARRASRLRPTQAAAAEQIAAELSAAELAAANVLVQLREQEAASLRLWMLYAPQL